MCIVKALNSYYLTAKKTATMQLAPKAEKYFLAFLATVLPSTLGFIFFPLYAKKLGPESYGIIALLETCQAIGAILLLFGMTSSFYVFYCHARSSEEKQKIFSTSLFFGVLLVGFLTVLFPLLPTISAIIFPEKNYAFFLLIYSFSIFSDYNLSLLNTLLRSEGKIKSIAVNTTFLSIVQHSLCLYSVYFAKNPSHKEFIFAFLLSRIATVVFCFFRVMQLKLSWAISSIDFQKLKEMLCFGAPLILTSITGWLLLLSDRFFINAYGNLADIGIYAVAYKLCTSATIALVQPFVSVWEPAIFTIFAENQQAGYQKLQQDFKKYLAIVVILFGGMLLFLEDFLLLVFSNSVYTQGKNLFPFLITSQFLMAVGEMWGTVCRLNKTSTFAFTVTAAAISAKIGLNITLVPNYLLIGAAFASLAAEICAQSIMAYYAIKLSRPRNLFFSYENLSLIAVFLALQLTVQIGPTMPFSLKVCLFIALCFFCYKRLKKNNEQDSKAAFVTH